jgi:hypothetical protein
MTDGRYKYMRSKTSAHLSRRESRIRFLQLSVSDAGHMAGWFVDSVGQNQVFAA